MVINVIKVFNQVKTLQDPCISAEMEDGISSQLVTDS